MRDAGHKSWWPDWSTATVVIIGAGPSAPADCIALGQQNFPMPLKVIAINESWRLWPSADVLYASDSAWWRHAKNAGGFGGLKVSGSAEAAEAYGAAAVTVMRGCNEILLGSRGVIGSGGNSGFQALNLAVQFGARHVVLLGFDMQITDGAHWHGRHADGLNNPDAVNTANWRTALDGVAPALARLGVRVINATERTGLPGFERLPIDRALVSMAAAAQTDTTHILKEAV